MANHQDLSDAERQLIMKQVKDFLEEQGLTQQELAHRVNVPQPFVCTLLQGKFKKSTPRTKRLLEYIRIFGKNAEDRPNALKAAIDDYLAAGGEMAVLKSSIEMLTSAYRSTSGMRAA